MTNTGKRNEQEKDMKSFISTKQKEKKKKQRETEVAKALENDVFWQEREAAYFADTF